MEILIDPDCSYGSYVRCGTFVLVLGGAWVFLGVPDVVIWGELPKGRHTKAVLGRRTRSVGVLGYVLRLGMVEGEVRMKVSCARWVCRGRWLVTAPDLVVCGMVACVFGGQARRRLGCAVLGWSPPSGGVWQAQAKGGTGQQVHSGGGRASSGS